MRGKQWKQLPGWRAAVGTSLSSGNEQLCDQQVRQDAEEVIKKGRREMRLRMGNLQQRRLRRSRLQACLCRSKGCTESFGSRCSSTSPSFRRCTATTGSRPSQPLPAAITFAEHPCDQCSSPTQVGEEFSMRDRNHKSRRRRHAACGDPHSPPPRHRRSSTREWISPSD